MSLKLLHNQIPNEMQCIRKLAKSARIWVYFFQSINMRLAAPNRRSQEDKALVFHVF
jgi:hypothetical protein